MNWLQRKLARDMPGTRDIELFLGELKEGALRDRCRTDTHKIILSLVDGQPTAVRLEPLVREPRPAPRNMGGLASQHEPEVTTLERHFLDGSVQMVRVFEERDL